jgi:hypothetical protein
MRRPTRTSSVAALSALSASLVLWAGAGSVATGSAAAADGGVVRLALAGW